jgi:hypothetical protein
LARDIGATEQRRRWQHSWRIRGAIYRQSALALRDGGGRVGIHSRPPSMGWFTEAFDTTDPKNAKALLNDVS